MKRTHDSIAQSQQHTLHGFLTTGRISPMIRPSITTRISPRIKQRKSPRCRPASRQPEQITQDSSSRKKKTKSSNRHTAKRRATKRKLNATQAQIQARPAPAETHRKKLQNLQTIHIATHNMDGLNPTKLQNTEEWHHHVDVFLKPAPVVVHRRVSHQDV